MSIFRNLNADFETKTRTLSSRSKGSEFVCVWKGLVHMHMHSKYEGYIGSDIEVMSIYRNLNGDPNLKVKVKGVKMCVRMERPCTYAHA